jgi:magnesium chelatase family protein
VVGLPDRAVAESRGRLRAALDALGLALPPMRITVNLAPADLLLHDADASVGLRTMDLAAQTDELNHVSIVTTP